MLPWAHTKECSWLWQQTSPGPTQMSPQQELPAPHWNLFPCELVHVTESPVQAVPSATGYLYPFGPSQHLLPGAAHALPQHCPPFWHGKELPLSLRQQRSPSALHESPQHSPAPQGNGVPRRLMHIFTPHWSNHVVQLLTLSILTARSEASSSIAHSPSGHVCSAETWAARATAAAAAMTRLKIIGLLIAL